MIKLYQYRTYRILDVIDAGSLDDWCAEHGYLPHHQVFGRRSAGWVVIKA